MLQQYLREDGTTSSALNYDFGLVTLVSPAPAGTTSLNIVAGTGNSVTLSLETAGYPADKPAQTMWKVPALGCRVRCIYTALGSSGQAWMGCNDKDFVLDHTFHRQSSVPTLFCTHARTHARSTHARTLSLQFPSLH